MTDSIVAFEDFKSIVDRWLKSESEGEEFPVDFDTAWQIAGYYDKATGKRKLTSKSSYLVIDEDYVIKKGKTIFSRSTESELRGRSSDLIKLTCDAFKHFCLMANTEQGRNIRQYFIEAEKKWKLVEKHFPEVANEVELLKMKTELARIEAQKEIAIAEAKKADLALVQFRYTITQTCPEPIQQKVLGFSVVEKVEYRDRVIKNEQLINDGSTISKTDLCYRYDFMTRSGKPDYKRLNLFLDLTGASKMSEAWQMSAVIQENNQFRREYLPMLDQLLISSDRQLHIGE